MTNEVECPDCASFLFVLFNNDVGVCVPVRQGVGR